MTAAFREAWTWSGVDEAAPGGPAMIVPADGSNFVQLEHGDGLHVFTKHKDHIAIYSLESRPNRQEIGKRQLEQLTLRPELRFSLGRRTFEIHGRRPAGHRGAEVQAVKPGAKTADAKLRVVVLKRRPITLSLRPVHTKDAQGKLVAHSQLPFDPDRLLKQMNLIWTPQTNIVFSLGLTTPAEITDEARIAKLLDSKATNKAPLPDIVSIDRFRPLLKEFRDPKADVTVFLVRKVGSGLRQNGSPKEADGTMDSDLKMGLVADNRDPFFYARTIAHEVGHFLGRYRQPDGTVKGFDDLASDSDLLMHQGGSGWKIPVAHTITHFNPGY